MTAALALEGVSIHFGGIRALEGVTCEIPAGQLRGIIGPNGSGKTTLLNVISRIYPVSAGAIRLFGDDITRWPNHAVARHGVMRTYQRVALVNQLTVLENVMLGLHATRPQSLFEIAFRTSGYRRLEREAVDRARETLEFVGIQDLADRKGDELSGGQMRLVEIARAVVSRPRVLLLDEPAAGLSLVRIDEIAELIRRINGDLGVTVVLVEHVLNLVMSLCERISVLVSGELLVESGTPAEVQEDPRVREAYLGQARVHGSTPGGGDGEVADARA